MPGRHAARAVSLDDRPPSIILRVPGSWSGPEQLARGLPRGYRLEGGGLVVPGGRVIELGALPRDSMFPAVFERSAGLEAWQRRSIDRTTVLVCLIGPGGSEDAARCMLAGLDGLLKAGGLGAFVDNSGAAMWRDDWLTVVADGSIEALLASLVRRYRSPDEVWSLGMHVIGLRDAVLARSSDAESDGADLNEFLLYSCDPDWAIGEGDLVGDETGPRYRLSRESATLVPEDSPLHNPYGRWRLQPLAKEKRERS